MTRTPTKADLLADNRALRTQLETSRTQCEELRADFDAQCATITAAREHYRALLKRHNELEAQLRLQAQRTAPPARTAPNHPPELLAALAVLRKRYPGRRSFTSDEVGALMPD